jgi:hypothetical protein
MGRFCPACGQPHGEGVRFCGSCGQSLLVAREEPAPTSPPNPATPETEVVRNIVPNLHAGAFGAQAYCLVLTDLRVIVARISAQAMQEAVRKTNEEGKAQGKGFLQRWGQQIRTGFHYCERYFSLPPAQILAEDRENRAIPWGQVRRVQIRAGQADSGGRTAGSLHLEWSGGGLRFQLSESAGEADEARRAFVSFLPADRVRYHGPGVIRL